LPHSSVYEAALGRAPRATLLKSDFNQAEQDSLCYQQQRVFSRVLARVSVAEFLTFEVWQLWLLRHQRYQLSAGVNARLASAFLDTSTMNTEILLWH
jgi:hypothetical protein